MILKKGTKRVLAVLLIIISLISANSAVCFAKTDKKAETQTVTETVSNKNKEDSYTAYLDQFSESDYSHESIVHKLNGIVLENKPVKFEIKAEKSGLYCIGMSYKTLDTYMSTVRVGIKLDGKYPYSNMKSLDFPRMWKDADSEVQTDDLGNEFASQQVIFTDYYYNEAVDETVECAEKYMVYLSKGTHKVSLLPVNGKIEINYFKFAAWFLPNRILHPQTVQSIIRVKLLF